jgi:hypothetical protein
MARSPGAERGPPNSRDAQDPPRRRRRISLGRGQKSLGNQAGTWGESTQVRQLSCHMTRQVLGGRHGDALSVKRPPYQLIPSRPRRPDLPVPESINHAPVNKEAHSVPQAGIHPSSCLREFALVTGKSRSAHGPPPRPPIHVRQRRFPFPFLLEES